MAAQKNRPQKKPARGSSSCSDIPKLVVPYPVPLKKAMEPTVGELQDKLEEVLRPYVDDANLSEEIKAGFRRVAREKAANGVWNLLAGLMGHLAEKSPLARQTLLTALAANLVDSGE